MKMTERQEAIQQTKDNLGKALDSAIKTTLSDMGENIQGIDWFSSYAEYYNEQLSKKAA